MPEIDFTNLPDSEEIRVDFSSLPDQPKRGGVTRSFADEATFREIKNATNGDIEKRARNASTIAATHDISESEAYEVQDIFTDLYGDKDLWDKATGSFKAGWGDMYSSVGGIMKRKGVGEFADTYIDFGERLKRAYIPPADQSEFTWRKMMDPEWYATTATRSVPFAISLVPAAVVGAYLGVQGAGLYGLGIFGQTVLGAIGGAALSRPIESAIEAQGAFEEATQKGFNPEDAESAADQVFWDNMKLSGLDAAEFATAFLPMGKVAGATAKRILARRIAATTGKLGAVGTMEAAEERYQEKAVMDAVGDFTSFFDFGNARLNEASAAGAVFGVGLGGAGSVFTALKNNVTKGLSDEVKKVYDTARNEALNAGVDPKEADLAGLDAVAGTPEGKAHIEKVLSNIKSIAAGEEVATAEGEEAFALDLNVEREVDETAFDAQIDEALNGEITDESISALIGKVSEEETEISILDKVKSINDSLGEKGSIDLEPIIDLGKSIWSEGHTTIEAFTKRAKELLSTSWDKVKDFISQAWEAVKAFNAQMGEKGSIGFDISDTLDNEPIRKAIADIKASGGLSLESLNKDYSKEQILELTRKNPGLISKTGAAKLDEIAQEYGFADGDTLLQSILGIKSKAKTKSNLRKQESAEIVKFSTLAKKGYEIISGSIPSYELDLGDRLYIAGEEHEVSDIDDEGTITLKNGMSYRVAADETVSFEAIKRAKKEDSDKENKALLRDTRRKLADSAKVRSGIKARIRQATGQYTVANLVREDTALKEGLKRSAQAAQIAMREGRKEGVTQEKARMKALLIEAKQRESARKAAQEIIDDIQRVRKRINSLEPEAQAVLRPILDAIDFTNMSEGRRADLSSLRSFYESELWAIPQSKEKAFAKIDQTPIRDYTIADLQDIQEIVHDAERLSAAKGKERGKAIKDIKRVSEMKGSIAVDYQKQINAIISGFDFKKPTEQKATELRSLRAFIEKNGVPLGINQKYLNELARLEKIPLKELTTDDLTSLRDTLKHLEKLGKLKASMKYKYNQRRIKEALEKLIEWTHNLDPKIKNLKDKSGRDRLRLALKQAYIMTLHTPRVAEMIDGYKQGENVRLIKWLSREETIATQEAAKKKEAFMADLKSLGIENITEAMEARMMAVMREREGARTQAETLIDHYKLGGVPTLTAQEEIIISKIKEYINAQKNDLAAVMEEITGEIFPEMETYYLPMKYEREEQLIPDANVLGGSRTTHTFDGFRHARVQGVKKVPRIDLINIFSEAIDEQFWYVRMQPVIEDIKQLVLSDEYEEAAGEMVRDWWRDELDIVARRGWSNSAKNTLMSAGLRQVRHNLNQSILLFKLSTIMLQPFAVFDAVAYTNAKYGPEAAAKVFGETTKCVFIPGLAKKYIAESPELQMRQGGELAMQEEMAALGIKEDDTLMDKASRVGYSMIRRADVNTAAGVQKAIEKMLTEQGAADAKTEAEFIMNLTNGSSTVVQRPHLLSTGEAARTWFTFQSFIMNRWGIIAHDLIMSGFVKSDTYKQKMLTLVSLGILMMAGNLEDEARKLLAKVTTGKEWKDKNRGAFADGVLNLTSTMPVFGSFINAAAMGMSASPPAIRAGENLTKGFYRLYSGKDTKSKVKGAVQATEAGLELFVGLPGTAQAFDLLEAAMFDNK